MLARAGWRNGISGFLALGLVAGLGAGFAATALAGARRADTAYARLETATRAPDHYLDGTALDDAAVARINRAPGVEGAARFRYTPVAAAGLGGPVAGFVAVDPQFLTRVYRPLAIRGRLPRRGAPDEVLANEFLARRAHLDPGDRVRLHAGGGDGPDLGPVTVVGISRGTFDFGPGVDQPGLLLPYAFGRAHAPVLDGGAPANGVLRTEAGVRGTRLVRNLRDAVGRPVTVRSAAPDTAAVDRQLAVQSIGLAALGLVALLATVAAAFQFLGRRYDRPLADLPELTAMGFPPRGRIALGAVLAVPSALVAMAVSALTATLASPLIPTGFARSVDPIRGIHPDHAVMLAVAGALAATLVGGGAFIAWRHRAHLDRPILAHDLRFARHLTPGPRLGLRAALAPARAPDGAAARGALVTTALAVVVLVGVLAFSASLTHLLDDPADYGWRFDAAISGGDRALRDLRPVVAGLATDPDVTGSGLGAVVLLRVDGRDAEGYALDRRARSMHPSLRAGRAPATGDEVALGRDLAARLHVDLGDMVTLRGATGRARVRVVGIATYPELGNLADLASALSLPLGAARRIGAVEEGGFALVRLAHGARATDLRRHTTPDVGEVVAAGRPPRVRNLEQVGGLPRVLAAFLVGLGLLAIAHGLWRTIRGRRREFAVLASMGLRPRELRSVVRWQAVTVALLALAAGIPLGILVGRSAWTAVADATGVVDRTIVPVPAVLGVAVGTTLVALLAGAVAGRAVTRIRPASVLRAE